MNVFGLMAGTLAVLPGMVARRSGTVVNVSSDSARAPEPGHGAYASSKAAVAAFTEAVAHEVAEHGVHVHVLYPAWVPTAMGLSGTVDGGSLPPRSVRRSEAQVSAFVLERMGGARDGTERRAAPALRPDRTHPGAPLVPEGHASACALTRRVVTARRFHRELTATPGSGGSTRSRMIRRRSLPRPP